MKNRFGSDLGLMHEVIITGRKVGFDQAQWSMLAENVNLMRAIVNFIHQRGSTNIKPEVDEVKIQRIAKLMKLIMPYTTKGFFCIDCGEYNDQSSVIGPKLLVEYEKLGIPLDDTLRKGLVKKDFCHLPIQIAKNLILEALGVDEPKGVNVHQETLTRLILGNGFLLTCQTTTITSIPNIYALIEAFKTEGFELKVRLGFENENCGIL